MDQQLDDLNANRNLFPSSFIIRALRDSRYHNTAYAIAELIDNSVDASAERIELLCMEEPEMVRKRKRNQISEMAVLDNGSGMDERTLLNALKFGGGTRHNSQEGVGKYGMGLPTSSMSQCTRVDVWTWQDGLDSAWHSWIDADAIEKGDDLVPVPSRKAIPKMWRRAGSDEIYASSSGTLVVWSDLDKVRWKTGSTIIDNTAREIGRIHRYFIELGLIRIRAVAFLKNQPDEPVIEKDIVANDPLYLMGTTSVPEEPWDCEPMFEQWFAKDYPTNVNGREETIAVKYSIVKREALITDRVAQNPGSTERGGHARHNIGVSVVREEREIVLEDAFLREGGSAENPQNRWWGCEVHFRRNCDEFFGLDHSKQMVANFTHAAKTLARDDRPNQVILDEMGIDEDDIIYTIVGDIRDQTRAMMGAIKLMFEQRRKQASIDPTSSNRKTPESRAVKTATEADQDAIEAGTEQPTNTDKDRKRIPPEEREIGLTSQFIESGQSAQDARELAKRLIEEDLSYQFNPAQLDGSLMFNVRSSQGVLHINLNVDHPIYGELKHLEDVRDENLDENDPTFQATVAIRLLLLSWARMEDQTETKKERTRIQNIAMNWGRHVAKFLDQLPERDG